MKDVKKELNRYFIIMHRRTQYYLKIPVDLEIQCHPDQNPRKLFCGYQQSDSKVYRRDKTPRIDNIRLMEENKVGGLKLSNFKIYYKAALMKTV